MYVWPMVFFLLIVGAVQAVSAQTLDGEFKAWRVFSLVREKQKTCYTTSSPVEQTGTKKRRGTPYVVVTHRGKDLAEVSVSGGYAYKEQSSVDVAIDTQPKHAFFTTTKTPQIAWARDAAGDKKVVEDLLKGARLTVTGEAQGKGASTDTYDLQGFPQAYKRMQALCEDGKAEGKNAGKPDGKKGSPADDKQKKDGKKDGKTDGKTDSKTGAKKDGKSASKQEGKSTAKKETKSDVKSETKSTTKKKQEASE